MPKKTLFSHPGQILKELFLDDMGIKPGTLARLIGVDRAAIANIIAGKRSITADMSLRLGLFFKQSEGFWLRLQTEYDLRVTRQERLSEYKHIILPYTETPDQSWIST